VPITLYTGKTLDLTPRNWLSWSEAVYVGMILSRLFDYMIWPMQRPTYQTRSSARNGQQGSMRLHLHFAALANDEKSAIGGFKRPYRDAHKLWITLEERHNNQMFLLWDVLDILASSGESFTKTFGRISDLINPATCHWKPHEGYISSRLPSLSTLAFRLLRSSQNQQIATGSC
jgi:hypothetical protein